MDNGIKTGSTALEYNGFGLVFGTPAMDKTFYLKQKWLPCKQNTSFPGSASILSHMERVS